MVTTAKWQDKNGTYRSKKELRPVRYIIDKKLLVCKYCKSEKAKEFKRGSSIENAGMTNATIFFLVCAFIGGYIIKSTYEINQNETTTPSYQTPVTNSENTNEGNKVSVQQIDTSTNIASLSSKQDTVNSKTDTSLVIMTTPNGDNTQDTLEKSDSSNLIEEDISNKTSLNIAVQLLKKGKSIKEVADSTGLSVDEVMFIKKHF